MSQVKLGDKNIPFIYQGNELLYPNPAKDGLVLYYDFKGITNNNINKAVAEDLSGMNNDGTLLNFGYTNESGYNNGLILDGVDDRILIGNSPSIINLDLEVTIEMVLHFKEVPTGWKWFIGNASDAAANTGYAIAYSPSNPKGLSFMAGGTLNTSGYVPIENEKVHIVGKIDKEKNMHLFMNGQMVKSRLAFKNMVNSSLPVTIGRASYYQSPHIKSLVKSTKIYNRALTDQEIQHNYNLEKERWGL